MKSSSASSLTRLVVATLVCAPTALAAPAAAQDPPPKAGAPRLKIESFAPARAYALGQSAVTLIGVVRNVGDAPLAEGAVSGRLTCVTGLDYTEGDTLPKLPALDPNAAMTFRWRVTPTSDSGPLVAAFSLEYPGVPPDVRVLGIQHLPYEPQEGVPSAQPSPAARVSGDHAVLENGRVRARIEMTAASVPGLWLAARSTAGWRRAGVALPLAEVLSGEGGQEPWWEVFRSEDIRPVNGVGAASLVVTGGLGIRWRATMTFTLRANSSVVDYDIRLSPLRPIKISGLRLGTLHAGDGSFGANIAEEVPYTVNGPNALAAVRSSDVTVGCSWPTQPLFREWLMQPTTPVPGADYQAMGVEHRTPGPPVELQSGAMVDYHGRIYALAPSSNVRDAFNIVVPPQRTVAKPASLAARRMAGHAAARRLSTSRRALLIKRGSSSRKSSARRSRSGSKKRDSVGRRRSRSSSVRSGSRESSSGSRRRSSRARRSRRG